MSRIICHLRQEAFRPKPRFDSLVSSKVLCEAPKLITFVACRTKYYNNRHRDQKYRRERFRKTWPIKLPDFDQLYKDKSYKISPEELRSKYKEQGVAPPNPWNEREMFQPCTLSLIDPYKPYEKDGKFSSLLDKVKSPLTGGKDLVQNRRSLSAIRSFEGEEFDLKDFANKSKEIYIKAHELLCADNNEQIFDFVTEHCWPVMTAGLKGHTVIWKYIDDVEPAKAVHVRVGDLVSKSNKYAQITVRFHSKQIMAVYDRHGRLILGSPTDVKEVLEHIVFEKYLANEYGLWRLHERIRGTGHTYPEAIQTRVLSM